MGPEGHRSEGLAAQRWAGYAVGLQGLGRESKALPDYS